MNKIISTAFALAMGSCFLVRWPGKAAAGSVTKATVSLVDILATVAAVVGEPLPPVKVGAEDSRSFLPVILGNPSAKGRDDMIVHGADRTFALRKGPWKWIEGQPLLRESLGALPGRPWTVSAGFRNVRITR